MKTYLSKYDTFCNSIINDLRKIIEKKGVESKHFSNVKCIKINDTNLMFHLSNGRYLNEISTGSLICDGGYTYSFNILSIEDMCKILDYIK